MSRRSVSLASATGILMASFVASRVLGLARDIAISNAFGTSSDLDAYLVAFRLPDILFQLLAGAALASAFIPVLSSYLVKDQTDEGWILASSILNLVGLVTAFLAAVTFALAPLVVQVLAPGFSPSLQSLVVDLTRIMLISPVVFSVSGIIMGILNARQHFLLPAIAPLIYNLSIIAGAVMLAPSLGVRGLAFGVVAGSFLHLLVQIPGLISVGIRYRPSLNLSHAGVRKVGSLMLPRVLGLAAVQVNFLVNTTLASTLNEGSLASINYAWALMMMPLGVFGMAISTAVFPTLAEQMALDLKDELRKTLTSSLRLILFMTIPACVGLVILREPLIAVLFQRGQFDESSTKAVAWALMFFSLGLTAHAAIEILTRAFYAMQDTRTPVTIGIATMVINVLLSFALVGYLGHGGLALSLSLATVFEALVLIAILRRRLLGISGKDLILSASKTCIASGAMAFVLGVTIWLVPLTGSDWIESAVKVIGAISVGIATYFTSAYLLRSEEIHVLISQAKRRIPGFSA